MMNSDLLVYQAKSFYNAYINLERISSESCIPLFVIPSLVNGAFAIELSFKAILAKNQINYNKEHNLWLLFEMLPIPFRCEIYSYLIEKAPEYDDAEKCAREMLLASTVFVDWRYAFEGKPVPAVDVRFLGALANASIRGMFAHYNVDLVASDVDSKTDDEIEEMFEKNRAQCIENSIKAIKKKGSHS